MDKAKKKLIVSKAAETLGQQRLPAARTPCSAKADLSTEEGGRRVDTVASKSTAHDRGLVKRRGRYNEDGIPLIMP